MSTPSAGGGAGAGRPENVGILAADVYFPSTFVAQVCTLVTGCSWRVWSFLWCATRAGCARAFLGVHVHVCSRVSYLSFKG